MKTKVRISLAIAILMALLLTSIAFAQYTGYSWVTAYQVVNTGDAPADITISYYDTNGDEVVAARKTFMDVEPGGSQLVVQFTDDPDLPSGRYSVVISADQPVAAITNQQLIADGATSYNPGPPFSTYSGTDMGSTQVTLPAVMYNWYGYFTDVFIMNIGAGEASDVDIAYIPGELNGEPTGASGVTDLDNTIPQYASLNKSQETLSDLGAGSGTFAGRFLGSAIITSDEPIIAVVNQHNPGVFKLMTYNGFSDLGALEVSVPNYMRNYFGYYTTLLVANPSDTMTATVELTYTPAETAPGQDYNDCSPDPCAPVTAVHVIPPGGSVTRYDGPPASDEQSDLDDTPSFTTFFGPVAISSDIPVVAQINIEAVASGPAQAGSYNGIPTDSASMEVVVPVVLADFYGYYTTLIVQNSTGTDGSCTVTYTSDTVYSAVPGATKGYDHDLPANGAFTVYEGRVGGQEIGDINHDTFWRSGSGAMEFIGAAVIECDVDVVAFVNEEVDMNGMDSMYTMNTFNK